jgi:NADPH2:quinone reductase
MQGDQMKAMIIRDFEGPEVFEEKELQRPDPKANKLSVSACASSINPIDVKIRKESLPRYNIHHPAVPGRDVSGIVEEIGAGK